MCRVLGLRASDSVSGIRVWGWVLGCGLLGGSWDLVFCK